MRRDHVQLFGIPHPGPKKRRRSRASDPPTEAAEQRMVAQWLNAKRLCWVHPPMEGKRSAITGSHLRSLGAKKGCPDILVFSQPPRRFGITGVAIELKRRNGTASGVSVEQRDWLERLRECGWRAEVCYGADEAIALLEELFGKGAG